MKLLQQQGEATADTITTSVRGMADNFAENFGDEALSFFGEIENSAGKSITSFTELNKEF